MEGYTVGKDAETLLIPITKTLSALMKTVEIATSSSSQGETFPSLLDLIIAKFPKDRTFDLLRKSSAMFATNPAKVGEWIQFMQNSLAVTFFQTASILSEARELSRLKDFLSEKIKKMNQQLARMTVNEEEIRKALDNEANNKDFLARRLHDVECAYLSQKSDFLAQTKRQNLESLEKAKDLERLSSEVAKSEEANNLLLAEVKKVREVLEVTKRQKKELLEAYRDFRAIFNSFTRDLSQQ